MFIVADLVSLIKASLRVAQRYCEARTFSSCLALDNCCKAFLMYLALLGPMRKFESNQPQFCLNILLIIIGYYKTKLYNMSFTCLIFDCNALIICI